MTHFSALYRTVIHRSTMIDCFASGCILALLLSSGCGNTTCRTVAKTEWPLPEQASPILPKFPDRATFLYQKQFVSSFESINDFAGFFITPVPHLGTTSQELSGGQVHSGSLAHRAWISGTNQVIANQNTNHRGYPTVELDKAPSGPYGGPIRIEFWVYLDMPLYLCSDEQWFSFATIGSYADDNWYQVQTLNMDTEGVVHWEHVPTTRQHVFDIFQSSSIRFESKKWNKLTILLDYNTGATPNPYGKPYVAAWLNEQLVSAATFDPRVNPNAVSKDLWPSCLNGWDGVNITKAETMCGLNYVPGKLARAHFGLYAPPLLSSGEVWNDDLEILGQ